MKIETIINSSVDLPIGKKTMLNIMFTQHYLSDKFSDVLRPFDLSGEQFNVLRILRGQKDAPANMSLIQERMLARTSNTTRLVDKLLLKNLVTREVCPSNRRKIEVRITKKGLALLEKVDPKVDEFEQKYAGMLTEEELIILNDLLEKFRQLKTE